jgi:dTDP-4-dehydrorhamnose 3,5-epimerase-like enzyme
MTDTIKPHLIFFTPIGSNDIGFISVAEIKQVVPFDIKRVYWTYSTPQNINRGHHAHKKLEQIIVAVNGVIKIKFENAFGDIYHFTLEKPDAGIYVPPGFWREIEFSQDAVLLCLASENYNSEDYIRDYEQFKNGNY